MPDRDASPPVEIRRLVELPSTLHDLIAESEREGFRFLRRLADDWAAGRNRFSGPGEGLWGAWAAERWIATCGLNVEETAPDGRTGRLRRLYVCAGWRRMGVGSFLVRTTLAAAEARFQTVQLRTDNAAAAALYQALGFAAVSGDPNVTHRLRLAGPPQSGR